MAQNHSSQCVTSLFGQDIQLQITQGDHELSGVFFLSSRDDLIIWLIPPGTGNKGKCCALSHSWSRDLII